MAANDRLGRMFLGLKSRADRTRLSSLAAAAVVLVLHWALPGFGLGSGAVDPSRLSTELSSGLRPAQPGHLQRTQPRLVGVHASPAKTDRSRLPIDDKPEALPVLAEAAAPAVAPVAVSDVERPGFDLWRCRAFDARAPPLA